MMNPKIPIAASEQPRDTSLSLAIAQLAREASIEINVQDLEHLEASRAYLPRGKKVYVSHLPKQTWQATETACRAIREVGFDPIPHVPVRLITDAAMLDRVLSGFVERAGVQEALLLAGDYPEALGPYSTVRDVLDSDALIRHGMKRISVAGHPEGHPKVALDEVRRAEREKAILAVRKGLDLTFVTQFFFEHTPFLDWTRRLRDEGVHMRTVGGLAGPASLTTLFRFAMRCGAGPSIRALGARPTSVMKLIGDHGPEEVIRGLAQAREMSESDFSGIHLFCFGGYLRTCKWLHRIAHGQFKLNERSFIV